MEDDLRPRGETEAAALASPGSWLPAVPIRNLAIGSLVFLLAVYLPDASICLVQRFLGVPCPACGATRSILALLKLSFLDSFLWNPGLWLGAMISVILFIKYDKSSFKWKKMRSGGLVAFLLVGVFRLILKVLFPDIPFLHLAF